MQNSTCAREFLRDGSWSYSFPESTRYYYSPLKFREPLSDVYISASEALAPPRHAPLTSRRVSYVILHGNDLSVCIRVYIYICIYFPPRAFPYCRFLLSSLGLCAMKKSQGHVPFFLSLTSFLFQFFPILFVIFRFPHLPLLCALSFV